LSTTMSSLLKLLVSMTAMIFVLPMCLSVELRLFPEQPSTTHRRYKKFKFSSVQVCYSFASCYKNIAVGTAWLNALLGTRFVFYDESECSSNYIRIQDIVAKGSVDFAKVSYAHKLSSFMLTKFTKYATGGMIDICQKENTVVTQVASNNSLESSAFMNV
ncbi:hypothetical protein PHMEG_00041088, partial [Phytophthora megakarya]